MELARTARFVVNIWTNEFICQFSIAVLNPQIACSTTVHCLFYYIIVNNLTTKENTVVQTVIWNVDRIIPVRGTDN